MDSAVCMYTSYTHTIAWIGWVTENISVEKKKKNKASVTCTLNELVSLWTPSSTCLLWKHWDDCRARKANNCQENSEWHKRVSSKILLIWDENYSTLNRWHHISSPWLLSRPVSMASQGGTGFKSRFDWPLGLLPSVLLISSLMASLRSVVKLVGQQAFILTHMETRHARRTTYAQKCFHARTKHTLFSSVL